MNKLEIKPKILVLPLLATWKVNTEHFYYANSINQDYFYAFLWLCKHLHSFPTPIPKFLRTFCNIHYTTWMYNRSNFEKTVFTIAFCLEQSSLLPEFKTSSFLSVPLNNENALKSINFFRHFYLMLDINFFPILFFISSSTLHVFCFQFLL